MDCKGRRASGPFIRGRRASGPLRVREAAGEKDTWEGVIEG